VPVTAHQSPREPPPDPPPGIDWLPASDLADGRPGRIGLTVLPGKRGPSVRYPGRIYRGDLPTDLAALRAAGVVRLVLLVDDAELARWGDPGIVERASAHGVAIVRHPMPDGGTPEDVAGMRAVLRSVAEGREGGDVAVACMGGVGRTGTVAACALVDAGWAPDDAIRRLRAVRHPLAVETPAQTTFVHQYYRDRGGASARVAP
jgi:protein-tyrosine phosphatase